MKTVLVAGASGAIGSALVPELLREPDTQVRLLLRAEDPAHLERRLRELFAYWELPAEGENRVRAFRGDVTLSGLGLDGKGLARLCDEVTHFVHAAGNVRLNNTIEEARASAVSALRNVVGFCRSAPRFEKLEYLSTIGVAGRMPGLIPEEALPRPREFHNTYEEAKAEAEDILREEMQRGLPATIHRPSMVVGDSHTGRIRSFQVFYHLAKFLSGRMTAGLVPDTGEHRLDIVPVDYVVRALALSTRCAPSTGRTLHLCSGPTGAPRLADLADMIRSFLFDQGHALPRLRRLRSSWFRRTVPIVGRATPGRTGRALRSLPHFLAYLEEEQLFENAQTRLLLEQLGLRLPRLEDYLEPVLAYRADVEFAAKT